MDTAAQAASGQKKAAANADGDDLHQFNSAEKLPSNIKIIRYGAPKWQTHIREQMLHLQQLLSFRN